jgi:hypothetical protein
LFIPDPDFFTHSGSRDQKGTVCVTSKYFRSFAFTGYSDNFDRGREQNFYVEVFLTIFFVKVTVVVRHRFDANPDSTFHFHADPHPNPDPTPKFYPFWKIRKI